MYACFVLLVCNWSERVACAAGAILLPGGTAMEEEKSVDCNIRNASTVSGILSNCDESILEAVILCKMLFSRKNRYDSPPSSQC